MLEAVCDNVWQVTEFMKMGGGVTLPIRMTVVRTSSGDVLLHSPVPLSEEWAEAAEALGPVRWIIAPNLYHHLFVKPAQARFGDAQLLCAPGLTQKRKGLEGALELDAKLPAALSEDFDMVAVGGAPKMNEVVLFHRPSASMIVSDLIFNVKTPPSFMTGILLSMFGTRGRFAKSRAWNFLVKDKALFSQSVEQVCAWPTARVIMAHGDIVDQDAAEQLRVALN